MKMSIFDKMREEREKFKPQSEIKSPPVELPKRENIQVPTEIREPIPTSTVKEPAKIIKEEIIDLNDEEKRDFIEILKIKYVDMNNNLKEIKKKIDDIKHKEIQSMEQHYLVQLKNIEEKYNKQKKNIDDRYSPKLNRWKNLITKFGGAENENKIETYKSQIPPGPEIDESYLYSVDESYLTGDTSSPELSKLIKDMDKKFEGVPPY